MGTIRFFFFFTVILLCDSRLDMDMKYTLCNQFILQFSRNENDPRCTKYILNIWVMIFDVEKINFNEFTAFLTNYFYNNNKIYRQSCGFWSCLNNSSPWIHFGHLAAIWEILNPILNTVIPFPTVLYPTVTSHHATTTHLYQPTPPHHTALQWRNELEAMFCNRHFPLHTSHFN